jgi:glycerate kinase
MGFMMMMVGGIATRDGGFGIFSTDREENKSAELLDHRP